MKKLVLGIVGIVFFNSLVFGANIGDKIKILKFTVLCQQYTSQHAKFWFINLLKKGDASYIEKISKGNCMPLSGIDKQNYIIGKVVKKKNQSLTNKDFNILNKDMKFEILKLDVSSIKGKKIKKGTQVFWFALPKDIPSYKILK